MIDALFSQTNYVAAKKMLDASVVRHEAIASNLANIETPNYKRIDLSASFSDELRQAVAAQNPSAISQLNPHLAIDPKAVAHNRDGNTVQLESELAALQRNFVEHTLETHLVNGALLRLRLAITGRPV